MSRRSASAKRWALWPSVVACGLALVVLCGDAVAQARHSGRFRRLVSQAAEAYNRNEPDVAINLLEQAYTINPNPLLLFNIGRAHELAGRLERALEYYDRFLAEHPEESQAQLGREARASVQAQLDARRAAALRAQTALRQGNGAASHDGNEQQRRARAQIRVVDQPRRFTGAHAALVATGAVLVAAGGVFGALALAQSEGFAATSDPAQRAGFQDRGTAFAWSCNMGMGIGLALGATGLLWFAAQPTRVTIEQPASASGPSQVGSLP